MQPNNSFEPSEIDLEASIGDFEDAIAELTQRVEVSKSRVIEYKAKARDMAQITFGVIVAGSALLATASVIKRLTRH